MVLHSRGCGRVARRRFTCWGFPSSLRSGNPIFYIPPVFFAFRPNPMRVPGRPFFVYSPVLFPACVPHVDSRLRGSCHSGTGCRRMVSFWVPSGPFTGGRFPRRPWIPWSPGRCGSPFRVFWVPNRCHSGTDVSSGYRRDVWVASFGYGLVSFRYQSVHSGVSDGVALGHLIHGLGGVTTTVPRASGLSFVRKAQGDAFSCRRRGLTRLDKDAVLGYRLRPSGMDHVRYR